MGGGLGALVVFVIIGVCLFALFLMPKGLTGITTQAIADNSITFVNPSPTGKTDIISDCYSTKLQVDYNIDCTLCSSKVINEYFWFKKTGDSEFTFLRGDRKTIMPNKAYTAEMEVDVCKDNFYEWYMCLDEGTLRCAGKNKPFVFNVV